MDCQAFHVKQITERKLHTNFRAAGQERISVALGGVENFYVEQNYRGVVQKYALQGHVADPRQVHLSRLPARISGGLGRDPDRRRTRPCPE